jgi:hypothetical protein
MVMMQGYISAIIALVIMLIGSHKEDAICDRLLHIAYRVELRGESMRKNPVGNQPVEKINEGDLQG